MSTICEACVRGDHELCRDIPDLDVELRFHECRCLHDPALVDRDAQITALLVAAPIAFARGDDEAAGNALEQALFLMQPWRAVASARRPLRLVKPSYAKVSGEPIPEWMQVRR